MTDIPRESVDPFRTKILSYLKECCSKSGEINPVKLVKLNHPHYTITLRELAWMTAICESQFSFVSINWEDKELQRNVMVDHGYFKKMIDEAIHNHSKNPQVLGLPSEQRVEKIYKLIGIIRKDIIHDCNNEAIPEYWITTNVAVKLFKLLQETRIDQSTNHNTGRLRWIRWEYNKAPEDFCRLTVWYSKEEIQLILEEAEKGNFSIFTKVIYPDNTESFTSLTPPEVTAVRNNSPDRTNIIIGGFFANIFELWVSKNETPKLFGLAGSNVNIPKPHSVAPKENEKESSAPSPTTTQRNKPRMRAILEAFAEYLIINAICGTYPKFVELMTITHIQKNAEKIGDECKFNDHQKVKKVYCMKANPKEGKTLKNPKYIVHFSIASESGDPIPQKPYSLSSFKDIFDTAIQGLRKQPTISVE